MQTSKEYVEASEGVYKLRVEKYGHPKFECMVCKRWYWEDQLPIIDKPDQRGDGCCTIGSLRELKPKEYDRF